GPTGRGHGAGVGEALGGGQAAKGLEQARHFVVRDKRPGIVDRQLSETVDGVGRDGDLAAVGQVVADGVVDQVLGQAFQQHRVSGDGRGPELGVDVDVGPLRRVLGIGSDVPCNISKVSTSGLGSVLFAACQGEQPIDQPLVALVDVEQCGTELTY